MNSDYLYEYDGGAWQVFAMRTTLLSPTTLLKKGQGIETSRIV